ncbi:MAG TPA: acyl-CoA carboxylase subunit epsilon [Streptosporangiaceae bacterium]
MSEQAVVSVAVVRGSPTGEEVAALVAVLMSRGSGSAPASALAPVSAWADPAARVRRPLPVGPGAWHRSSLPGPA